MNLDRWRWLALPERVPEELRQSREEGRDVSAAEALLPAFAAAGEAEKEALAEEILDLCAAAPPLAGYPYVEPEDYESIRATLPDNYREAFAFGQEDYAGRIKAAWQGRAAGCLAGIPVEGKPRAYIRGLLEDTGNWPMRRYMRGDVGEALQKKYGITPAEAHTPYDRTVSCWRDNMADFPVDDDTNYSVQALRLFERYGKDFTPQNVAESWLYATPALHMCTAERVAYQNFLNLKFPPFSASWRNPYREFIGAQIRADFYGWVRPGNPAAAAELAYRDASVSHTKNGVYGAMYAAALISLAPVEMGMEEKMEAALRQIPPQSRLWQALEALLAKKRAGAPFAEIVNEVHQQYDEASFFDWCHVIPNAVLVSAVLLYHGEDYTDALGESIMAGFDTDCNGATVGSFVGLAKGAIPGQWLEGLEPVIHTSVCGYESRTIDALAKATLAHTQWPG